MYQLVVPRWPEALRMELTTPVGPMKAYTMMATTDMERKYGMIIMVWMTFESRFMYISFSTSASRTDNVVLMVMKAML